MLKSLAHPSGTTDKPTVTKQQVATHRGSPLELSGKTLKVIFSCF